MITRTVMIATVLIASSLTVRIRADEPPVEFDAPNVHPWTEIKPPASTRENDKVDHKVILIVIPISANFNVPEEKIERIRYQIRVPEDADVIDFLLVHHCFCNFPVADGPTVAGVAGL